MLAIQSNAIDWLFALNEVSIFPGGPGRVEKEFGSEKRVLIRSQMLLGTQVLSGTLTDSVKRDR